MFKELLGLVETTVKIASVPVAIVNTVTKPIGDVAEEISRSLDEMSNGR